MYIHNNEKLIGSHEGRELWRDHRLESPGFNNFSENTFYVIATRLLMKEYLLSMIMLRIQMTYCKQLITPVIIDTAMLRIEEEIQEFFSERQTLFQQCSEKEVLKFDLVLHFYLAMFFNPFHWLWNEPLNKLPLTMKHTT